MKVFTCPKELPEPEVDYLSYDRAKAEADERGHKEKLTQYHGPMRDKAFDLHFVAFALVAAATAAVAWLAIP
jgi:hypothetical protein